MDVKRKESKLQNNDDCIQVMEIRINPRKHTQDRNVSWLNQDKLLEIAFSLDITSIFHILSIFQTFAGYFVDFKRKPSDHKI